MTHCLYCGDPLAICEAPAAVKQAGFCSTECRDDHEADLDDEDDDDDCCHFGDDDDDDFDDDDDEDEEDE